MVADPDISYEDEGQALIVLSFDPGMTTGWALHRLDHDVLVSSGFTEAVWSSRSGFALGQLTGGEDEQVDEMVELTRYAYSLGVYDPEESARISGAPPDVFVVVMEDFVPRFLEQDRSFLAPVRLFSKYERELYRIRKDSGVCLPYVKQSASDAKNTVTDARLSRWNLYRPGMSHARDAQRHGILAARKYASTPQIRARWCTGSAA